MVRVVTAMRRPARDVDDDAAVPFPEVLDGPSAQIGARLQVERQVARPSGSPCVGVIKGRGQPRPGVVDQYIDGARGGDSLVPQAIGRPGDGEIRVHGMDPFAE
jgi:hypothetical protein